MRFKDKYPDFADIEIQIRQAHAERQVAIATAFAGAIFKLAGWIKRLALKAGQGLAAERDRRAIEADAFLKRSVPRY